MLLSVVIPVFNEQESLRALHQELAEVAAAEGYDLDVVFVDDGSTDGSWEIIRDLASGDPRVRGFRFRCNFGKAAALSAGFAQARGELVMTLDADLQDDPREVPRFLAEMDKGAFTKTKKNKIPSLLRVYPKHIHGEYFSDKQSQLPRIGAQFVGGLIVARETVESVDLVARAGSVRSRCALVAERE